MRTALIVINDVRGAMWSRRPYTVEGDNPIFDGPPAAGAQLADDVPIDRLHWRLEAPLKPRSPPGPWPAAWEPSALKYARCCAMLRERDAWPRCRASPTRRRGSRSTPCMAVTDYTGWDEVDAWASASFAPRSSTPARPRKPLPSGPRWYKGGFREDQGGRPALCAGQSALLLGVF